VYFVRLDLGVARSYRDKEVVGVFVCVFMILVKNTTGDFDNFAMVSSSCNN
jgi:hypothetical protein